MSKDTQEFLTLVHYKEPLTALPKSLGFGFFGAISITLDGVKMQCHLCGKLFGDVGTHARQAHSMHQNDYREKFQLSRTTSLISESVRLERKERTIKWWSSLSQEQKKRFRTNASQKYEEWRSKQKVKDSKWQVRLETKNKRGVCPDQLIEKIKKAGEAIGRTPSKDEFIVYCGSQRYVHLIYKTFGSWVAAVKKAGLTPKSHYSFPKGTPQKRYSEEELLEYLLLYHKETGKIPTESDSLRGFIPNTDLYRRHFGGMQRARELAGIEQ